MKVTKINGFKYSRAPFNGFKYTGLFSVNPMGGEQHQFHIYTTQTDWDAALCDLHSIIKIRTVSFSLKNWMTKEDHDNQMEWIEEFLKSI